MPKKILLAHLALFATATIYGANYIIAKDVMNGGYLRPATFILIRVASAGIIFLLLRLAIKERIKKRRDWYRLIACGLFGVAINQLLFFSGLEITTPINASLIMTTTPILVLVAAAFILRERITLIRSVGILTGAIGAAFIITSGSRLALDASTSLGDLFIFINACSYGIYLVLVKPLMLRYQTITVISWIFVFGFFFVLPFGWLPLQQTDFSSFHMSIWLSITYVIICTTCLTYFFNAYALRILSPSVVSAYIYLQPLLATLLALSLQKDSLSMVKVVGGLLIFLGVFLVSRPKTKRLK